MSNKLKTLMVNLINEINKPQAPEPEVKEQENEPQFIIKNVVTTEGILQVKIGSLVTYTKDGAEEQLPDGNYPIEGEDNILVITDGVPSVVPASEVPSAPEPEVKEQDVETTLTAETQSAIDQVVDADIAAEDNPDTTTEEVEQNIAVEAAFAKFQEVIDDLVKRVAELEAKLADSDAKDQEIESLKTELSQVKSETPSVKQESLYQRYVNCFR